MTRSQSPVITLSIRNDVSVRPLRVRSHDESNYRSRPVLGSALDCASRFGMNVSSHNVGMTPHPLTSLSIEGVSA